MTERYITRWVRDLEPQVRLGLDIDEWLKNVDQGWKDFEAGKRNVSCPPDLTLDDAEEVAKRLRKVRVCRG